MWTTKLPIISLVPTKLTPDQQIEALREELRHHEHLYYVLDAPEIADGTALHDVSHNADGTSALHDVGPDADGATRYQPGCRRRYTMSVRMPTALRCRTDGLRPLSRPDFDCSWLGWD